MKSIKLISLKVHNFKGIRDFGLQTQANRVSIFGANATGKTTLFDAFTWLLFGKNSEDSKKFNVKPLDSEGNEILGLEPEIEAVFSIDEKPVKLHRVLKENWVKPKGQLEKQRKPDTTVLYVNDVPKKVKEYQNFISTIIDEETFKMMTNPEIFVGLHWTKQRSILTEIVGNVDDQEVINSKPELIELSKLLNDHSVDDQRKVIAAQKKQIKKDVASIPARIDEAERAKPETINTSEEQLKEIAKTYQTSLEHAQDQVVFARNSDESIELKAKRRELQSDLVDAQAKFNSGLQLSLSSLIQDFNDQQQRVQVAKQSVFESQQKVNQITDSITQTKKNIEVLKAEKAQLLGQYHKEKDVKFDESATVCPTCGQNLPADKVTEIRKHFNLEHAQKLADIVENGSAKKNEISLQNSNLEDLNNQLNEAEEKKEQAESKADKELKRLNDIQAEIDLQKTVAPKFESSKEFKTINQKINDIDLKLENATSDNTQIVSEAQKKVEQIKTDLAEVNEELAKYNQVKIQDARIAQLKQKEFDLKKQFNELDKTDHLIDQFIRAKVSLLESKINQHFKLVSFKLFELQKNGELNEICEAQVDGVPYSDLNNAARINAGLDIINTLSEHYQLTAPIFIDNAESVNKIIDTKAQQIALIVTKDKKLKVSE
ncbi:MAG: AAA family ATPase [Liquorilactobacillus nagelii]|uniref:AAA family ATPase n=1 Tax=Lactobacillaceae TaxID=33958 RepID=UPI0039EB9264